MVTDDMIEKASKSRKPFLKKSSLKKEAVKLDYPCMLKTEKLI